MWPVLDNRIHDKLKNSRPSRFVYRNSLIGVMALTKFFENINYVDRYNFDLPMRWTQLLDTLSTSSTVAYNQISLIDEDVEEEFERKTERLERRVGRSNLYSEDELEELRQHRDDIKLPE